LSDLLLGLDIGTSSSKAVVTTPDGAVIASAVREHSVSTPWPGQVEHDADAVWLADLVALVGELRPSMSGRLAAIGISGIGP
jgi:xylulokinase